MIRKLHWRITLPLLAIIILIMSAAGAYLVDYVTKSQLGLLRSFLDQQARIIAQAAIPSLLGHGINPDALAKKIGVETGVRITIIAGDGVVLGDSVETPSSMGNHSERSEVMQALLQGYGESIRYSTTLRENMIYIAVPVKDQQEVLGIARIALPTQRVEQLINQVTWVIMLAILTTAILVIAATWYISRTVIKPVKDLTLLAKKMTSGDMGQKISVTRQDEIGELGRTFNEMTSSIDKMLQTISSDRTRLATILVNMTDGVILVDRNGCMILSNHAAEEMLAFQQEKCLNKPLIEVVHDHEIDELLKSCLKTGTQQSTQMESIYTRRFIRVIAIAIRDTSSPGALLLLQDLSELRNLQTMRRELVGNISHELRTPIAGIKALVDTLQDGAINDKEIAPDFLSRIKSETERMAHIVSELTELSRIETGKQKLNMEETDLNSIITAITDQLNPQAARKNITISTSLAAIPILRLDKERIQETIINLVDNAIKFNRTNGAIEISTSHSQDSVNLTIFDTGIGISRENLPHIFDRFFKADKSRSQSGSGLGLAIAKHTILAHCGSIQAFSEEGKGTRFVITIPVAGKRQSAQDLTRI